MRKLAVIAILGLAFACTSRAQSTTLTQTSGTGCVVTGCTNAKLSDGELFTWGDTLVYYGSQSIFGKLQFRGMHYQMSGQASWNGYQVIDLSDNGFAIHEAFSVRCYRSCTQIWQNGYLSLPSEYVGADPADYGNQGYPSYANLTTGTGQVGVVTASMVPLTVTLVSGDTSQIQVPSEVTIPAGSLYADFTITATAPTQPNSPPYLQPASVTITATFQDGQSSTFTVVVQPLSPPPPSDEFTCLLPHGYINLESHSSNKSGEVVVAQ